MQNPNFVQLLQNPKSKRRRLDFGSWTAGTGHVTNEDVWPGCSPAFGVVGEHPSLQPRR